MARAEAEMRLVTRNVAWAHDMLEMSDQEIGRAVQASGRSVSRWANGITRPTGDHLDAVEHLDELRELLTATFGDDRAAAQGWLHSPIPALGRRSPMAMIRRGKLVEVVSVLASAEDGVFY